MSILIQHSIFQNPMGNIFFINLRAILCVLDGRTAPRTAAMDTFRWGSVGGGGRR